jgi:hypothetical protein
MPARLVAEDAASGLALVASDGLREPPLAVAMASASGQVAILARGQGADGARTLLALPGDAGESALSAPLQPGAAGAPVFAGGALAGIVVSDPSARLQVAGVVLASRHRIASAATVETFLKAQNVTMGAGGAAAAGLGALSAKHGRSVAALACGG